MDLVICKTSDELTDRVTAWCANAVAKRGAKSLYLPAGNTPMPIYSAWCGRPPEFLRSVKLVQIDDVLTGDQRGLFHRYFTHQMKPFAGHFEWIGDGQTQADLGLLGLGLNGHVAFHEPGLDRHFYSGCVPLSPATCANLKLVSGTWGITYGVGAFRRCKALAMIVTGSNKWTILSQLLQGEGNFPASALMDHSDFTIFADSEAAGRP